MASALGTIDLLARLPGMTAYIGGSHLCTDATSLPALGFANWLGASL
ncbi:hypothetical protein [Nocardia sp. CNY236]|nr:hypothetical protein [Nocardia sp. CNY236]